MKTFKLILQYILYFIFHKENKYYIQEFIYPDLKYKTYFLYQKAKILSVIPISITLDYCSSLTQRVLNQWYSNYGELKQYTHYLPKKINKYS
jgi:hypothetical protein